MPEKQKLIVKLLSDRPTYGFATSEDGQDVYLDRATVTITELYIGRTIWASISPSPSPNKCPVARDVQLDAPIAPRSDVIDPGDEELYRRFVELKASYFKIRLAKPIPALEEEITSFARELAEAYIKP